MIVNVTIDKRGNKEFLSAPFEYIDIDYLYYFTEHDHVFNVDLIFPNLLIKPLAFRRLVESGYVYER